MPIGGTIVFVPPNPCLPGELTSENVALEGSAHVLAQVMMDADATVINVHVNLVDVMGTGDSTGRTYLAVGAARHPPNPCSPESCTFNGAFDVVQAGRCGTLEGAAPVSGSLSFMSDGTLDADASRLSFGSLAHDIRE